MTSSAPNEKRTVLIADDEPTTIHALEKRLSEAGYQTCTAQDGYAALSKAKVVNPDIILLDIMIRGMHGMEIKRRLNQEESTVNIPVVFLTDKRSGDEQIREYLLKADDYFTKPFDFQEIIARVDQISARRKQYEQLFMTDPLTGLSNVHVFKKNFAAFFNVARRYNRKLAIAVLDVNDFKTINDTYGHAAGDHVLRTFADTMRREFREPDLLIRYGGDEFVILFPETGGPEAVEAVERLRKKIVELKIPMTAAKTIGVKMSAGVAEFSDKFKRPEELFEWADQLMYKDKKRQKEGGAYPAASGSKPAAPAAPPAPRRRVVT